MSYRQIQDVSELSLNGLSFWDGSPIQKILFFILVEHVLGPLIYPSSRNADVGCPDVLLVGVLHVIGLRGRPVMHLEIPCQVYSHASDVGSRGTQALAKQFGGP